MLERVRDRYADMVALREIASDDSEAQRFGVVIPPMIVIDNLLVAAGRVPLEESVKKLLDAILLEGTRK
jgi:hypothetical protein